MYRLEFPFQFVAITLQQIGLEVLAFNAWQQILVNRAEVSGIG